jgi:hypothetical protein
MKFKMQYGFFEFERDIERKEFSVKFTNIDSDEEMTLNEHEYENFLNFLGVISDMENTERRH